MSDFFNFILFLFVLGIYLAVYLLEDDINKLKKSDRKINALIKALNEKDYAIFCKLMYETKDKKK